MRNKLHRLLLSTLVAASVAIVAAPAAQANRGNNPPPGYVPPPQYGQNVDPQLPGDPYGNPVVAPTVVPVDLPGGADPGAGLAGGGNPLGEAPNAAPTTDPDVLGRSDTRPEVQAPSGGGVFGGVLSRTGSETMPLVRAGLAALTLGAGLVMLGRRRRQAAASA